MEMKVSFYTKRELIKIVITEHKNIMPNTVHFAQTYKEVITLIK